MGSKKRSYFMLMHVNVNFDDVQETTTLFRQQILVPHIVQLINYSPHENGSCSLTVALMVVLEISCLT